MQKLQPLASSSLGLSRGEYHYTLCPITAGAVPPLSDSTQFAIISSDDRIRKFNCIGLPENVDVLGEHKDVSCIAPMPGHVNAGIISGGRDGYIKHWDARVHRNGGYSTASSWQYSKVAIGSMSISVYTRTIDQKSPFLSIASDPNGYHWACGTELTSSTAEVLIWDMRSMASPVVSYTECHNDDVCVLGFSSSPLKPGTLLSGSTDGLVNIYAPSFPTDEDEALVQVINHGSSIHQAGFLPQHPYAPNSADICVYALSHDEKFSIYKREDASTSDEEDTEMIPADAEQDIDPNTVPFGDIRPLANCEYVVDVLADENGGVLAVGNHSKRFIKLYSLSYDFTKPFRQAWTMNKEPCYKLEGAHGEEIVRTISFSSYEDDAFILTAGEDGLVKTWRGIGTGTSPFTGHVTTHGGVEGLGTSVHSQEPDGDTRMKRRKERDSLKDSSKQTKLFRPY